MMSQNDKAGRSAPSTFRVSMILHQTEAGWRVIHFHESALSAQAARAMAAA